MKPKSSLNPFASDRARPLALTILVGLLSSTAPAEAELSAFAHAQWESMGILPGSNSRVTAMVTDEAGNVYVGGDFSVIGSAVGTRLAMWDGEQWTAVGNDVAGLPCEINALALMDGDLYVAGTFVRVVGEPNQGIAKWDGREWISVAAAEGVRELAVMGGDLYASGQFERVDGAELHQLARWDGQQWHALGKDVFGNVRKILVSGDALYVTGVSKAGGQTVKGIARWQDEQWSPLGSGPYPSGSVKDLAVIGELVYAVGSSGIAGGESGLARWDGEVWSPVEVDLETLGHFQFDQIEVREGKLVGVGREVSPDPPDSELAVVVEWDGQDWERLGSAFEGWREPTLVAEGGELYRLGNHGVVQWNGEAWTWLAESTISVDAPIQDLQVAGDRLVVGGLFSTAGGRPANMVAAWDGEDWMSMGGLTMTEWVFNSGPFDNRGGFVEWNGALYVGAHSETSDGVNGLVRWDGTDWSSVDLQAREEGVFVPMAFAPTQDQLFANGSYSPSVRDGWFRSVFRWDGFKWHPLLLDGEGQVEAVYGSRLTAIDETLFVAGRFEESDGEWADKIMQWDGYNWSALGEGVNGPVFDLAVLRDQLIVAGSFSEAGGKAAGGIALWDGASWSPLGNNELAGGFHTVHVHEGMLYAAGSFSEWNGEPHHGEEASVARWDGQAWDVHFQRFPERSIRSMAVFGNDLYLGGTFLFAGDQASAYIARLPLDAPAPGIIALDVRDAGEVRVDVRANSEAHPVLERSSSLQPGTWQVVEDARVERLEDRFQLTDSTPAESDGYYRMTLLPQAPPSPPLYAEDFENGAAGWSTRLILGTSEWELGTPTLGITEAHSGTKVFATDLDAKYEHNSEARLRSPLLDLADVRRGMVSFWFVSQTAVIDTKDRKEGVWLRILNDKEEPIFEFEDAIRSRGRLGWNEWTSPLPKVALGKKIQFEWGFVSDDRSWNGPGFFIDDVTVSDGGMELSSPRGFFGD